jgi:hypothetical protein
MKSADNDVLTRVFSMSALSCEFNRSMQHDILIQKNEVLKNETETKNLL